MENLPPRTERPLVWVLLIILLIGSIVIFSSLWPVATTRAQPSYLLISEVFYDTPGTDSDEEWIEIYNPTGSSVSISNYKIGDEETEDGGEGMYQFPASTSIGSGDYILIALKATGFYALYGSNPDFEVTNTDGSVPDMIKYSSWASGSIGLNNNGDEVLLLDGSDAAVDVVTYEEGSYSGVTPHTGVTTDHSIERYPVTQDTDDCSDDFRDQDSPTPGSEPTAITLSTFTAHPTSPQPTFFRWQWLALAGAVVAFGGVAVARRLLGR